MKLLQPQFDLENKSRSFLDMYYSYRGAKIIAWAPKRKFDDWDEVIDVDGRRWKVEVKSFNTVWDRLLIELLEDALTGDKGWYYQTKADTIIYVYFPDKEATEPKEMWIVSVSKIREYLRTNMEQLIRKPGIAASGYGLTMFITIPKSLGKKIYPVTKG